MTIQELKDNNIDVGLLDDNILCELIDNSHDWEFCQLHGLFDELTYRTGIDFIDHNNGEFIDALVYVAMEKLGYTE